MRCPLAKVPFFGTLVLYHCDGCGRRRAGWEDRRPRRWAELHLPAAAPGETPERAPKVLLHECSPCRRSWSEARLARAREDRLERA